jgi:fimbrial chaperone protein
MRLHLIPVAIVALLLAPRAAAASNFTVSPTQVDLSASATSALVALHNSSKLPLRFEVTLVSWSEDEHGKMVLTPSSDVSFFPKLVELAAGASRNIRIGINAAPARDVEQSFRLFIEELPDQSAPALANAVALRTKIGIPVFVRPAKPSRSAAIEAVSVENGKVLARVRNTGNLHVSVDSISVKGTGGSGPTFTKEGRGWYVLPGATRVFEVPITATECKSTTSVAVEVFGHNTSIKGAGQVSPAACAAH